MAAIFIFLRTCSFMLLFACIAKGQIFNVKDFGALGDGKTDDAQALVKAWGAACKAGGVARVLVPVGNFLCGPLMFQGPCKGPITFELTGTIKAPHVVKTPDWISFRYVNKLTVLGKGAFDGNGAQAWSTSKCSKALTCTLPINVRFDYITDGEVSGISSIDSKYFHFNVLGCKNIRFHNIKIIAPKDSVNTDGIHIGRSDGVHISDSTIATGDDCVSIGDGAKDVTVINVNCGPGHGISIGSLGMYQNEEPVSGVSVKHCTLTNTLNGVRIKTWPNKFANSASNLHFEDITMNNVLNPILIDQEYCPHLTCSLQAPSKVKLEEIYFTNIRGTSASKLAVNLICSRGIPCNGVHLSEINLKYTGKDGPIASHCSNTKAILSGAVNPPTKCI